MNKSKKIGKGAGVLALALALAFGLEACGGDGGGGGGTTLGPSALGDSLIIEGAQVYNGSLAAFNTTGNYEKYTGAGIDFTVSSSKILGIGGKVKITGGKLDFTANAAAAENLNNVKAENPASDTSSLAYLLEKLNPSDLDYKNLAISGTGWENAKYAILQSPLSAKPAPGSHLQRGHSFQSKESL